MHKLLLQLMISTHEFRHLLLTAPAAAAAAVATRD
jgi:hypothetical protein